AGRCDRPSVLRSDAEKPQAWRRQRNQRRRGTLRLCPVMRSNPRACPCALRRSGRDRWYTGKSGVLDDAIASFATAYADQTSADHAALVKAKGTKPTATKQ